MRSDISFRPITPEDGAVLVLLHRRAILLDGVRAYPPDVARSWACGLQPDGYARSAAAGEAIELALLGPSIAGFCGVRGEEIAGLYVDPAFTRLGIGSALMRRALKRIAAEGHARARVSAALSAAGFYEAMGFELVRGRMHATPGGLSMPVLEMTRELAAAAPAVACC